MRTWIILASDGRHVSVSRVAAPSDAELDAAASSLAALGLGGWLCTMDGDYYRASAVKLTVVRECGQPDNRSEIAFARFHTKREVLLCH